MYYILCICICYRDFDSKISREPEYEALERVSVANEPKLHILASGVIFYNILAFKIPITNLSSVNILINCKNLPSLFQILLTVYNHFYHIQEE